MSCVVRLAQSWVDIIIALVVLEFSWLKGLVQLFATALADLGCGKELQCRSLDLSQSNPIPTHHNEMHGLAFFAGKSHLFVLSPLSPFRAVHMSQIHS